MGNGLAEVQIVPVCVTCPPLLLLQECGQGLGGCVPIVIDAFMAAGETIPIFYPQLSMGEARGWEGQSGHSSPCPGWEQRENFAFLETTWLFPVGKPLTPEGSQECQESSGTCPSPWHHHLHVHRPSCPDLLPFGDPAALPITSSPISPKHLPVLKSLWMKFPWLKSPFPARCRCCPGRNSSSALSAAALSASMCRQFPLESGSKS